MIAREQAERTIQDFYTECHYPIPALSGGTGRNNIVDGRTTVPGTSPAIHVSAFMSLNTEPHSLHVAVYDFTREGDEALLNISSTDVKFMADTVKRLVAEYTAKQVA